MAGRWGRSVIRNIQKFVLFELIVIVTALTIDYVAFKTNAREVPLTAVQLLWINLIIGTLGALALATVRTTERQANFEVAQALQDDIVLIVDGDIIRTNTKKYERMFHSHLRIAE